MRHEDSINTSGEQLTLKGKPLKKVDQFRYLGATITSNGDCTTDITIRTATALSVMSSLSSIFKNRKIASKTKIRLYKSLIQPIALYGCETWTLRQTEEKKLLVFEMTALRLLLGVTKLDKLRNENIREQLSMNETILQVVQHRQNQWLGHVLRMKDDRIAKNTLVGRTEGTRRVGKPRTSWLTSVLARTGMRLGDVIRKAEKRCDWSLLNFQAGAYVRPPMQNMTRPQ